MYVCDQAVTQVTDKYYEKVYYLRFLYGRTLSANLTKMRGSINPMAQLGRTGALFEILRQLVTI